MKAFTASILSAVCCFLFYIVLDINVLDYLSEQDNEGDVINFFYRIENGKSDKKAEELMLETDIILVDLEGNNSRKEIADIIRTVDSYHPRAIILDLIFPTSAAIDSITNQYLSETLADCDNIFIACRYLGNGQVEHSYFSSLLDIPEGLANSSSYFKPFEVIDGEKYFYLPYLTLGIDKPEQRNRLINYKNKYFDTWKASKPYPQTDLTDVIVLIGDLSDSRDMHDMPFPIEGKRRVSGLTLMAYHLSSVLHNDWIKRTPDYLGWIIAIAITFFFALIFYPVRERKEQDGGSNVWNAFIERIWRISLLIAAMFLAYLAFSSGRFINLSYAILCLALSGITMDAIDVAIHVWGKIRKR